MSVITKLKDYLDTNHIKYVAINHSPHFTAQEIAASLHVPGNELAKTIILKGDDNYIMAVLPASHKIDYELLADQLPYKEVKLAKEIEFENLFQDCEVGAMPPFGNLYSMPVYVEKALSDDDEIVFNAGTHTDVIRMKYSDYFKLVNPIEINFSEHMN